MRWISQGLNPSYHELVRDGGGVRMDLSGFGRARYPIDRLHLQAAIL
jgi:hypothetical protein